MENYTIYTITRTRVINTRKQVVYKSDFGREYGLKTSTVKVVSTGFSNGADTVVSLKGFCTVLVKSLSCCAGFLFQKKVCPLSA